MDIVSWDDSFSISVDEIDAQHQKLFGFINNTVKALHSRDINETRKVIKDMYDYTVDHFGVEEKFFRESGYPKMEEHLARHKLFTDRIKYFEEHIADNFDRISQEMISYLGGWLMNHILTYDREYVPYWEEYYKVK